jgi:hypothetical protein
MESSDGDRVDPGALVSEWYRLKGELDGHLAAAEEIGRTMDEIADRLGSEFGIVLPRAGAPQPQAQPQPPVQPQPLPQQPVSVSTGAFAPSEIDRIRADAVEGIVESDFAERIAGLFERATRGLT